MASVEPKFYGTANILVKQHGQDAPSASVNVKAMFKIKRITDPPESGDGFRVLIDRVWPRDVNKGEVSMDLWLKEIAPSTELDQWFAHNPEKWEEFQRRYARELDTWPQLTTLLKVESADGPVTLLYFASDPEHNQAVALKAYLQTD